MTNHHLSSRTFALPVALLVIAVVASTLGVLSARASSARDQAPAPGHRTVLITGANRGLGLEFARQYHDAGWTVIATAREPKNAADLRSISPDVEIVALDVADPESVAALASQLKDVPIDLLINNAGVSGGGGASLAGVKPDEYERVLKVNAIGPMRVTQALLPSLKAGTGKMVVSISSGLGSIANNTSGGFYAYRESKAALNMFMRTLAAELKDAGFICIAMSPGWVKTDMGGPNAKLTPEESIGGMRKVIAGLKPEDTGKFWNHDGTVVPW